MNRPRVPRRFARIAVGALGALLVSALAAAPALAQEPPPATVADAEITVDMGVDGSDSVEATYTIEGADKLEGGVEHLLVTRPGAAVGEISVSGDAEPNLEITEGEGVTRILVPVSAETASYTLSYTVTRDEGVFGVVILAPNLPPSSSQRNVAIQTMLPEGEQLAGEFFPSVSRTEEEGGRLSLIQRVINVPSVVIAEYGASAARISLSEIITVVALVVFLVVLVGWYRQQEGKGGEQPV